MSTQPDEIEEGEIVSESEGDEELSVSEEEDFEEDGEGDEIEDMEGDDEMMFEDEGLDIAELMTSLLATEDGDTVCTALVGITQQLQMQNKILIKILSELKSN
jgi:hypothetical protein|tara:strand:- start:440 stop:748 length:309 start_codon:yes stop_codon:yes gene_type:complete